MRHFLLLLITLILFGNVSGQKIEFSVSLNSGLFSFRGESATKVTAIGISPGHTYVENDWGSKNGVSYGASLNLKKITKRNFLIGVDLGYEVLRSKSDIPLVYELFYTPLDVYDHTSTYKTKGQAYLNNSFVNLYPFIGHRYKLKNTSLDLSIGSDIGFRVGDREEASATRSDGVTYSLFSVNKYRDAKSIDIRPRVQLSIKYMEFGVYAGYSYGLTGYMPGNSNAIKSRLIRFGVLYQLK